MINDKTYPFILWQMTLFYFDPNYKIKFVTKTYGACYDL
jgi:hypothetical protein